MIAIQQRDGIPSASIEPAGAVKRFVGSAQMYLRLFRLLLGHAVKHG